MFSPVCFNDQLHTHRLYLSPFSSWNIPHSLNILMSRQPIHCHPCVYISVWQSCISSHCTIPLLLGQRLCNTMILSSYFSASAPLINIRIYTHLYIYICINLHQHLSKVHTDAALCNPSFRVACRIAYVPGGGVEVVLEERCEEICLLKWKSNFAPLFNIFNHTKSAIHDEFHKISPFLISQVHTFPLSSIAKSHHISCTIPSLHYWWINMYRNILYCRITYTFIATFPFCQSIREGMSQDIKCDWRKGV